MAEAYWKAQENRIRKLLDDRGWIRARRNPGSGAIPMPQFKGDVWAKWPHSRTSIRIDHKSTRGVETISLQRKDLQKLNAEAKETGDFGAVTFSFKGKHDLWAVVPLPDLLTLLEDRC